MTAYLPSRVFPAQVLEHKQAQAHAKDFKHKKNYIAVWPILKSAANILC